MECREVPTDHAGNLRFNHAVLGRCRQGDTAVGRYGTGTYLTCELWTLGSPFLQYGLAWVLIRALVVKHCACRNFLN